MTTRATPPASEPRRAQPTRCVLLTYQAAVLTAGLVLLATPAATQVLPELQPEGEPRLTLNAAITGGYDGNIFVESIGVPDPRYREDGAHTGTSLDAIYSRQRDRWDFVGTGGASFRFYRTSDRFLATSSHASLDTVVAMTDRLRVRAAGGAAASPYYFVSATTTSLSDTQVRVDHALVPHRLVTGNGSLRVNYELTGRSSVAFDYARTKTDFVGDELDITTSSVGGLFTRGMTRHGSLRLGYRQNLGKYGRGNDSAVTAHTIDVGVDYGRGLQLTNRTVFGFSLGTSAINDGQRTRYEPTGQADLTRRVSARSALKVEYRRSLSFIDGYRDAYFSDSVIGGVITRFSRGVTARGQIAYTSGQLGFVSDADIDSYSASLRVLWRMNRIADAFAETSYHRYEFRNDIRIAGVATGMNRAAVRFGLETSFPLMRERTTSAAR
jgi:hypothetical protein